MTANFRPPFLVINGEALAGIEQGPLHPLSAGELIGN